MLLFLLQSTANDITYKASGTAKLNVIKEAHEKFKNQNATDDTQLVKSMGYKIKIVPGKEQLLKLTRLEDTNALEAYIEQNEYLQN